MRGGNILRLAALAAKSNFRRLDFPYKLNFIVTEKCNSRCRACRIWAREPAGELSLEEITSFFARSNDFSWVDLSGGEIFLREDLVEIVGVILERCRRLALLHFPTNGLLVDRIVRCTRDILSLDPPRLVVTVSVDGPRELHDSLRGARGSFDSALETYRRLHDLSGCEVFLGMTLMPGTEGKYGETLDAVREVVPWVTPDDMHVNIMHHSAHYYGNLDLPSLDRDGTARAVDEIRRSRSLRIGPLPFLEERYLAGVRRYLESGRPPLPCRALSATCYLGADGTVYPCTSFDRPLGSMRDHGYDLRGIWSSPQALSVLEEIRAGGCPGCWTPCEAFPAIAGNALLPRSGVVFPGAPGKR